MCSSIHGTQQSSSPNEVGTRNSTRVNATGTTGTGRRRRNMSPSSGSVTEMSSNSSVSGTDSKIKNVISARRRTVYIFYFMAFLDLLAVSLFLPLMSTGLRSLGASHLMTGLVGSAYGAVQLVSSPVVGWGSDVYGQKLVLAICLIASSLAYIVQGFAFSIVMMLGARVLAGIFKHTQTVGKSIVAELTSSKDASYVLGNFNAFGTMGFIVGPTMGAHIAQLENGFQMVCFICASAFMINSILLILFVPEPSSLIIGKSPTSTPSSSTTDIKKSEEKETKGKSVLRSADFHSITLLAVRFLFSFATLVFRENLVLVLQDKFSLTLVNIGYLTSLQSLVSTVLGFAVGPVNTFIYRGNSLYMVLVSGILKTVVLLTLFYSTNYWLATIMLVAVSSMNPFLRVGITAVSLEGHQHDIGTILGKMATGQMSIFYGFSQSATSLARMISPTVAGIAMSMSEDGPFLVAAAASMCGIVATLIAQRFGRRSRRDIHHAKKAD